MARLNEIREALDTAKGSGAKDIILLKCVSGYPAKDEEMNLRTIPDMAKRFKLQVGLSDHTLGIVTSIAAVSLGAKVIEKHFTLSRRLRTLDNFFSIEPKELKLLVDGIRTVEKSLGKIQYTAGKEEAASRIFRRSLFIVRNMKGNEVISKDNIRSIRPGFGLHTRFYKKIIGKRITRSVSAGTPMRLGLVSPGRNK
jgi:sialic acid synthase SpsE